MDILCVKCGEPWDSYGIDHGDMKQWEIPLFQDGVGCPSCKGVSNGWEPQTIDDIENSDDDPLLRLHAWEDSKTNLVEWKKPDNKVFWECFGCGVQVIGDNTLHENNEDYIQYHLPRNAAGNQWYHSHNYNDGCPEREPAHTFGNETVCEFCLKSCDKCDAKISNILVYGDVYDDGWCSELKGYSYGMQPILFCIDCIESACAYCHSFMEDCDCHYCSKCGETTTDCDFCKCECMTCNNCTKNNACYFDKEVKCDESCEFVNRCK